MGSSANAVDPLAAPNVFRRHLVVVIVVLPVSLIGVATARDTVSSLLLTGYAALLVTTIATALPLTQHLTPQALALPFLADIIAIAAIGAAHESLAAWICIVVPVMWLARSYERNTTAIGVVLAAVSITGAAAWAYLAGDVSVPYAASVGVGTVTVAAAVGFLAGSNRATVLAQSGLLRRQASMLESALHDARSQSRHVRRVHDAVDLAVLTLRPNDMHAELNGTARRMLAALGIAETERLDELPFYQLDGKNPLGADDYQRLVRGELEAMPVWLGQPGRARIALSVSSNKVIDENGNVSRVVVAARDITAERTAIEARDDMITSLSHELRTPMSSVLGYIELVLDDRSIPEHHRSSLQVALKNSGRMMSLINDLMQARTDSVSAGFSIVLTECDVAKVLTDSLEGIRPLAADRLITVSVDGPDSLIIDGDPFRMRNVLDNLISNAVKYNETGGWIDITLTAEPVGHVTLAVTNTGKTLNTEEQGKLFERFYRSEAARRSTTHGTGIGLSVVREIVQLHHGTIGVESDEDSGMTTFTVVLPIHQDETTGRTAAAPASAPWSPS